MNESWRGLYFAIPGGGTSALLLAILFVLIVIWDSRRHRLLSVRLLRVGTALCAFLLAVQPRGIVDELVRTQGRLAVLLDGSRSMTVGQEHTRAERARKLLNRWKDDANDVALYRFGSTLEPEEWNHESDFQVDDESRLSVALEELLGESEDFGGVIILSDGMVDDIDPAMERNDAKIHAVHIGEDTLRDDSLVTVRADNVAFLRQPATMRVTVQSWGSDGEVVPLTLMHGDEVVAEKMITLPEQGRMEVEFSFVPYRLGRAVYRVVIPVAQGDVVPSNNERVFLVRVVRDRLRVLLVAGEPTWDVHFLRAFLKRDPGIDLISFFILRTNSDMTMAHPDELALIPFPTDELFREHLGSFDVVIFQDFDYGPYQMGPYLPRIRDYVRRGGAFAMIGGDKSFTSGGYSQTPLAEILPVLLPLQSSTSAVVTESFQPKLDIELIHHPLLAITNDPRSSLLRWQSFPPLDGANITIGTTPGAITLMTHPTHRHQHHRIPILVLSEAQEGRVLSLMVDTSWRWGITAGGTTGDASAYERFWDRALRWLARDPSLEPARVTTEREHYGPSALLRVRGLLRDARYQPLVAKSVRLAVVDRAGIELSSRDVLTSEGGQISVELEGPEETGAYRVQVLDEERLLCEEEFVVEAGGNELADPRSNIESLRDLTQDGQLVMSPEEAPDLDAFDATRIRHHAVREVAPFATWWAFVISVFLFSFEWWWRRRMGLK